MSAAAAMGKTLAGVVPKAQPRLVHGGAFRNASTVALDKNIENPPPRDFVTVTHANQIWTAGTAPVPTHRFDLPQKNKSVGHVPQDAPGRTPANSGHFVATSAAHFSPRDAQLIRPPGKGGVDMTKSAVPLGRESLPPTQTHAQSVFLGRQVPPDERIRLCPSRGTLGVRVTPRR